MKVGLACRWEFKQEKFRTVNYADTLLRILVENRPAGSTAGFGTGTYNDPYRPSTLSQWYGISQLAVNGTIFIEVGSRLIARWGTNAKKFKGYCTDVTGFGQETNTEIQKSDYEDYVADWGRAYAEKDKESNINPTLPSYVRKAYRVSHISDMGLAIKSRSLLQGDDHACDDCVELASSLCSLFIAEANRAPETFAIALMLLDLVQTSTTYGKGGAKTYTWTSMLCHDVDNVRGRSLGVKDLGKHPMAGQGTAPEGAALSTMLGLQSGNNKVANRAISIMSVWLAHYLASRNPKCQYYILEGAKGVWKPQGSIRNDKGATLLRKDCTNAVNVRNADCGLLIGGTTVYYEDIAGEKV